MAQTARISNKSDHILQEMVKLTGLNKSEVIESALADFRHKERMRRFNESYLRLKNNPAAWEEELKDREELEGTIGDGLEDE